jgi:hypothetical protein
MSDANTQAPGTLGWMDLTVDDAEGVRDFYKEVVGFSHSDVPMGEYSDFCMNPPAGGDPTCGVCHARGSNDDLPPVWIPYFIVEDIDKGIAACTAKGGSIVAGPKSMGQARYCIIKDPAGAVCAIYQP